MAVSLSVLVPCGEGGRGGGGEGRRVVGTGVCKRAPRSANVAACAAQLARHRPRYSRSRALTLPKMLAKAGRSSSSPTCPSPGAQPLQAAGPVCGAFGQAVTARHGRPGDSKQRRPGACLVLEALDLQHQHLWEAVDAQVLGCGRLLAAPLAVECLHALQGAARHARRARQHWLEVACAGEQASRVGDRPERRDARRLGGKEHGITHVTRALAAGRPLAVHRARRAYIRCGCGCAAAC